MKILIMGLPGSGKTTLGKELARQLEAAYFNADEVRKLFDDWDFSDEGRERQAYRMSDLCDMSNKLHTVADFVCPTNTTQTIFNPDFVVFMDTIMAGRYEDTNKVFERPTDADFVISEFGNVEEQAKQISDKIKMLSEHFNPQAPTGVMIGRFQPFHDGHKKLFEKILEKQDQVLILVRDTYGDEKNPFNYWEVAERIDAALYKDFGNKYQIMQAPNICGVYYGREVGYEVERIHLDAETESISATDIRKEMGK